MKHDHNADMEELRRRHEGGDRRAVLDALFICLCSSPAKEVPEWARWAFHDAYAAVFGASVGSWDDVFGKPKGRIQQRRARKLLETPVWKRCRTLHAAGQSIDDQLFATVAAEFDIGARQVKQMFYDLERAFGHRSNLWGPPRVIRRR